MNTFNINRVMWIDGVPFVEAGYDFSYDNINAQDIIDDCEEEL